MSSASIGQTCPRCLQVITLDRPRCPVCAYPDCPPNFTLAYGGRYRRFANSAFERDAQRVGQFGYRPLPAQAVWRVGERSKGSNALVYVAFGIAFGFLGGAISGLFPPRGSLSIVYGRWDLTPEQALARPDGAISWAD